MQATVARATSPSPSASAVPNNPTAIGSSGDALTGDDSATANETMPSEGVLHGRLPVQMGVSVGAYFDDNIYIAPNGSPDRISDYIGTFAPFVAWNSAGKTGALNSVQLVYTPTFLAYLDHPNLDAIDHDGDIIYGFSDGRVDLLVTEQFTSYQENNPDVGTIFRETANIITGKIDYQIANKISAELVSREIYTSDSPGYQSNEFTVGPYFNYAIAPKVTIGLGVVGGVVDMSGPNQYFEQTNLRASYNPDPKLTFDVVTGIETRETQGNNGIAMTPDLSCGGTWSPFDDTEIELEGYRRYEYSGRFTATDYLATGVTGSVSQRLFRQFKAIFNGSFEDAVYVNNWTAATDGTSYDYLTVKPSFDWNPEEDWDFRVFYQYRVNVGRGQIGNFTDNQIGFTASYTY